MIEIVGAIVVLIVVVILIVGLLVKKLSGSKKTGWSHTAASSKRGWASLDISEPEDVATRNRLAKVLGGAGFMALHSLVFYPAIWNYMARTSGNPVFGFTLVYFPLLCVFAVLISAFVGKSTFDLGILKVSLSILLAVILLDLWFPTMIVTGNSNFVIVQGYYTSSDFVLFKVWQSVLGLDILNMQFSGISVGWILVYIVGTIVLCLAIMILWVRMPKKHTVKKWELRE
jgi:hypothetical protein